MCIYKYIHIKKSRKYYSGQLILWQLLSMDRCCVLVHICGLGVGWWGKPFQICCITFSNLDLAWISTALNAEYNIVFYVLSRPLAISQRASDFC